MGPDGKAGASDPKPEDLPQTTGVALAHGARALRLRLVPTGTCGDGSGYRG